jgi:tRNA(Ile)-lysidine synthase
VWRAAHPGASEAAAREARLDFFADHARTVWLGHQQDDIAENLLMRLARGSGTAGLAAPRPVQELPGRRVFLRPLLPLKKTEIEAALESVGVRWRRDASNAEPVYFRNRVRLAVVGPWCEAAGRDAIGGAARSRLLLDEDDRALEAWVEALAPVDERKSLQLAVLAGKPRALWRRALHRWLARHPAAGEPSRQAFEALLAAIEAGKKTRHSLGRDGFAVCDGKELRFVRRGKRPRTFKGRAN